MFIYSNHNYVFMNPNIGNEAKIGPTTKIGKLRNSLHGLKYLNSPKYINPNSMAARAVGFDGSYEKLQAYLNFVSFVLGLPLKTLSEIERMEGLLAIMETNLAEIIKKQEEGKSLTDKDRKDMFLVKDTLAELHEMKYGKKHITLNADLKDIRDAMFEE